MLVEVLKRWMRSANQILAMHGDPFASKFYSLLRIATSSDAGLRLNIRLDSERNPYLIRDSII